MVVRKKEREKERKRETLVFVDRFMAIALKTRGRYKMLTRKTGSILHGVD